MSAHDIFQNACLQLKQQTDYPQTECNALIMRLMAWFFGVGKVDILVKKILDVETEKYALWQNLVARLAKYEPLQYIMQEVEFAEKTFFVNPHVLIPRPETEEWTLKAIEFCQKTGNSPTHILDVCTGSGCIIHTLAGAFGQARAEAWDISAEAIAVGKVNGSRLGTIVEFKQLDALTCPLPAYPAEAKLLLVSNPPYIPAQERATMQRNVLDYEPDLALFVSDDAPLIFYERLAYLAMHLKPYFLMVEIHEHFAEQVLTLFQGVGYPNAQIYTDFHGKPRAVWAERRLI